MGSLPAELKRLDDTGLFDTTTFNQVLEMDEDDEHDFSKSIVYDFFDQAENTFGEMEMALEAKDLPKLSALGHFLKGSSATLGLALVKNSCEKLQHLGAGKDETGTRDEKDANVTLAQIKDVITQVKGEYEEAKKVLEDFYES